ncbi:MAG: peptidase S41 [Epulopiscium sp. Nele67-Bin005]|nr:MAG: peptidase S41 [Epulopiscium sp. Nele67-Bin005]
MRKKGFLQGLGTGFITSVVIIFGTTAFIGKDDYIETKLDLIEYTIDKYYVGELDKDEMEQGIYRGFVAGVGDPYTAYYSPQEFSALMEQTSGIYAGIGVQMTVDSFDNSITVVDVFAGSPAEAAGILIGDRIVGADGVPLTGSDFDLAPTLIKGKEGTNVIVSIYRPTDNETYELDITRQNVVYPSVEFDMLENNIGYIELRQFEELTHEQFKNALTELEFLGARGIVLDLRDNTGGLLNVTEKIVDELIPEGIIVSTKDNSGKIDETWADDIYSDIPLVVLVNEQSASASEVLSGALQDHGRAELVGTRTFGKGIVQTILPLTDGSALKITTSEYYTPSGVCIQGTGIEPDHYIDLPIQLKLQSNLSYEDDLQLQKAIEVLETQLEQ